MKKLLLLTVMASAGAADLKLESKDLQNGQAVPLSFNSAQFGCSGQDQSPELHWSGVPEGTKSLAVTVYDRDAPTGSGFWHWTVMNLPADTRELPANAGAKDAKLPAGAVVLKNDAGEKAFIGSCPPAGREHHYFITVHALDYVPELKGEESPALAGFLRYGHELATATIEVTHKREKAEKK